MRRSLRATASVALLFSCIFVSPGCSEDGDGENPAGSGGGGNREDSGSSGGNGTGDSAAGSPGETIYDIFGIEPPPADTPFFDFSKVEAEYDDAAGCEAYNQEYPENRACVCENCFDLLRQCDALEGCREMTDCGLDKGCIDENDCYFGGKCTEVFDRWGNTGTATSLAQRIQTCSTAAGCPRPN